MKTALISGGFDPLHNGHIRLIKEAAKHGTLHVALNSDRWLIRKKGFCLMPRYMRQEILANIKGVYAVIPFIDEDDTACEAIRQVKPDYFINGGDRQEHNTPEVALCRQMGIEMIYDAGGDKVASSTAMVRQASSKLTELRPWGSFRVIEQGDNYWVKILRLDPHQQTSLQYHNHRREKFLVLEGDVRIVVRGEVDAFNWLPVGTRHRLVNNGDSVAVVLEIARGDCREDDIVRVEDDYGRQETDKS